jgi:pimeloyl-ACP methyl ester carboxylesterase
MSLFLNAKQSVHYLLRGHGEALLMIHGLGSSGADWAMQVPALERRFRLIVPDLPGCGHSGGLPENCSIGDMASCLWALLDHLDIARPNIVGFSLGGAVGLEMSLQRPESVPRLALINSLSSYEVTDVNKWLEARLPSVLIGLFGMQWAGRKFAARLFPHPWQDAMRDRAAQVVGAVSPKSYLGLMRALEHWTANDRLGALACRTLVIAAEHDYVPIAEKHALAASLHAELLVIRGSRHGTPFDSIAATNAILVALLTDAALPAWADCECDEPEIHYPLSFVGSLAEQHALGPQA